MAKNPRSTQTGDDDYSIYPRMDDRPANYGWRIGSYDERGVLSVEQIDLLEQQSGLPREVLERCSIELGNCLENDAAINVVEVRKSVALRRAKATLQDVRHEARHAARKLDELSGSVLLLSDQFAADAEDRTVLRNLKKQLTAAVAAATLVGRTADLVLARPGSAADMSPRDKRRIHDKRRQFVVETCCYAWQDAGWKVSYTTRADLLSRDELQGALVEFIDHVVPMLTDPPKQIARGTLKKDIDSFRGGQSEPDELLTPPEFGNR